MKLNERISWLMETVQQSLFLHLDECLPMPLHDKSNCTQQMKEKESIEKKVKLTVSWLYRRDSIKRSIDNHTEQPADHDETSNIIVGEIWLLLQDRQSQKECV